MIHGYLNNGTVPRDTTRQTHLRVLKNPSGQFRLLIEREGSIFATVCLDLDAKEAEVLRDALNPVAQGFVAVATI